MPIQRAAANRPDLDPLRGWVRKLSGAERHAREVTACIAAGSARRALLQGVAVAQSCGIQAAALAVTQLKKTGPGEKQALTGASVKAKKSGAASNDAAPLLCVAWFDQKR